MIEIIFNKLEYDDEIRFSEGESGFALKVSGHSGFDEKGRDIVCAAVSILYHTLLVSISKVAHVPQDITDFEGCLATEVITDGLGEDKLKVLRVLLHSFCVGLFEMVQEYPEYIHIKFED